MIIDKDRFIEDQMNKFCRMCLRRARVIDALKTELPDKAFLFEMQEKFHEIVKREG